MIKKNISTPLKLDRPTSLVQATVNRLRKAVVEGDLQGGQHLVEASMARDLGISRGPLREAFRLLAAEGLLEIRHDRGVFVPQHSDTDVEQMIVSRAILESAAARLFVLRADTNMQERLRNLMIAMEQEVGSVDTSAWRELDWAFHETLLIGSGNIFLHRAWAVIGRLLRVYMLTNTRYEDQREDVINNHRRMCAVLLGDNPAAAEAEFSATILTTGYSVLDRPLPDGLIKKGRA